jgi:hypothetical protein
MKAIVWDLLTLAVGIYFGYTLGNIFPVSGYNGNDTAEQGNKHGK